ncbi:lysM domain receptor-like kinase 3 isoform X5 [Arachis hypogaea]|uniref:lysM domain receptor-like kinase 3 isoform X5 n=1 Tax=Arachis hypogaea TaxID=3818 RepID=UPI003B21AC52
MRLRTTLFTCSRLLIFDNIENGSLKEHLNDPLNTPLNWRMRLQIANEVVAALVVYASEHSHYIYNRVNFGMDPSRHNHKGSQKPRRFDN